MIDKGQLDQLFTDRDENLSDIRERLYQLSAIVVHRIRTHSPDDLVQDVWLSLIKAIPKYQAGNGSAYSYFYKIAQRSAWKLANRIKPHAGLPDCEDARLIPISSAIPLTSKVRDESRTKKEMKHALKLLDRIIAKAGQHLTKDCAATAAIGIAYLQEYRMSLIKEYKPLRLGGIHYSKTRKTTYDYKS